MSQVQWVAHVEKKKNHTDPNSRQSQKAAPGGHRLSRKPTGQIPLTRGGGGGERDTGHRPAAQKSHQLNPSHPRSTALRLDPASEIWADSWLALASRNNTSENTHISRRGPKRLHSSCSCPPYKETPNYSFKDERLRTEEVPAAQLHAKQGQCQPHGLSQALSDSKRRQ